MPRRRSSSPTRNSPRPIKEALTLTKVSKPIVIDYDDPEFEVAGEQLSQIDYESFIASGDPDFAWTLPDDEWDAISLNYTSGTTGNPKGVVYHHRGAYLLAQGNVLTGYMPKHPVYLWTLPMFHCNGWCFPWSISVVGGTHVTLRWVRPKAIWDALADHKVTHLCGAPIVMSTILDAPAADKRELTADGRVLHRRGTAARSRARARWRNAGFNVTHLYGLTETYGPAVVNDWEPEWDALPGPERAAKKARQGVRYHALEGLAVMDPETMTPVPWDGETMGEVMFRGNVVMKGYLKNPKATTKSFKGGWFHSGDLGVLHTDGYHPAQGPLQGHHHLGRREHLIDRGRGRALQASRRSRPPPSSPSPTRNGARRPAPSSN